MYNAIDNSTSFLQAVGTFTIPADYNPSANSATTDLLSWVNVTASVDRLSGLSTAAPSTPPGLSSRYSYRLDWTGPLPYTRVSAQKTDMSGAGVTAFSDTSVLGPITAWTTSDELNPPVWNWAPGQVVAITLRAETQGNAVGTMGTITNAKWHISFPYNT